MRRTASTTTSACSPTGQKTDGTWYVDLSATYPVGETGFALFGHYGYLDVSKDGSGPTEASYQRLEGRRLVHGARRRRQGAGGRRLLHAATTPRAPFYTDLTGYDTAKDRGVVYVKKTF